MSADPVALYRLERDDPERVARRERRRAETTEKIRRVGARLDAEDAARRKAGRPTKGIAATPRDPKYQQREQKQRNGGRP